MLLKTHIKDHKTLLRQLSEFRLADTKCQVVEDRAFVLAQITEWFGSADEFEIYVRGALHSQVESLLQEQIVNPYGDIVIICLGSFFFYTSGCLAALARGDAELMWRWVLCYVTDICLSKSLWIGFRRLAEITGRRMQRGLLAFQT
ncbi:unnamed protein product [Prorocentrum cordatum]|uniref:Uncharacterized protein n=1 Tax=Prorocentrum cordatum TaxID=2364126 RepID=A0ABN9WWA6_9DINO|nr:unnamed protein product [Polarella glacialis]